MGLAMSSSYGSFYKSRFWKQVGPAVRGFWALFALAILASDIWSTKNPAPRWHVATWTIFTLWSVWNWYEKRRVR